MTSYTREKVIEHINKRLQSARHAASQANEFAVECAKNNSISGSGERAVAEQESASWQETVGRFERLHKSVSSQRDIPQRVSLPSIVELDLDGDTFTAVVSDVNCHLQAESDDLAVVTPESPLGKAIINRAPGDSFEYQVGKAKMSARVRRIF